MGSAAGPSLSHHLAALPQVFKAMPVPARPERRRVGTGTATEAICGYSRAVRIGERILVSGTTATHETGEVVCPGDVEGQTTWILDRIAAALRALGAGIDDVVRTRIYLRDGSRWAEAARTHGRVFGSALPANTLIEVRGLIGGYEVEIEAEAIVGPG